MAKMTYDEKYDKLFDFILDDLDDFAYGGLGATLDHVDKIAACYRERTGAEEFEVDTDILTRYCLDHNTCLDDPKLRAFMQDALGCEDVEW